LVCLWERLDAVLAEGGRGETWRGPVRAVEVKGRAFGVVWTGALAGGAGQGGAECEGGHLRWELV